jgi:Major Facilitator Superfamily
MPGLGRTDDRTFVTSNTVVQLRTSGVGHGASSNHLDRSGAAPQPASLEDPGTLGIAQLMLILDVTVVAIALPDISMDLGLGRQQLTWVVSGYTLAFGGLLLLGGRAADLFGARRLVVLGLLVFAGASLLAGLAPTGGALLAGRVLQGLAAALLSPSALSLVERSFGWRRAEPGAGHLVGPVRRWRRPRGAAGRAPHRRPRLALGVLHQRAGRRPARPQPAPGTPARPRRSVAGPPRPGWAALVAERTPASFDQRAVERVARPGWPTVAGR